MPHTIHIHIVNGNDFRVNCGSTATCIAPDLILLVLCQRTIVRFITGAIVLQPFLADPHEVIADPMHWIGTIPTVDAFFGIYADPDQTPFSLVTMEKEDLTYPGNLLP
jgi:hypothetical protein